MAQRKTPALRRIKRPTLGDFAKSGGAEIEVEWKWCRQATRLRLGVLIAPPGVGVTPILAASSGRNSAGAPRGLGMISA